MHTFELSCKISPVSYQYLHDNLPHLVKVSNYVERTNYYSAKGVMQIELRTYEYAKYGMMMKRYYLVLRCNPSIIMGKSKILLVDLEEYSSTEILEKLMKRIYEINELRYIRLDKQPVALFLTSRADVAADILVDFPQIVVWLCNMSFPYGYHNMKRKAIKKEADRLYIESCCFCNGSRAINIYYKMIALINTGKEIPTEEQEQIQHAVRLEAQLEKRGIYNMKLPTKRSIEPFLEKDFCHKYLEKEIKAIFGIQKYVSRGKAVEMINNSQYKPYDKAVMLSIVDMIHQFKGLYELEKAIADSKIHTPPQYGNLRSFKERWLKKFKNLGIQPITILDSLGIDEVPSIYNLLRK
ncbi:MAG: hypothetical protein IJN54_00915 [Lachnospiraceae bacterium]|nr:hypothetical protein [Lachnospiraceae bacterium]